MNSSKLLSLSIILLLSSSFAKECQSNNDCFDFYQHCPASQGECSHKGIFPMQWDEFIGTFLVAVGIGLCNAAGIGGGPVMLPLIILFHNFRQAEAVALATFLIFVGALVRFIKNFKHKHPTKTYRVSVDYNIIVVLIPMSLFGTTIGVLINSTFPDPVIMVLQTIVFAGAAFMTFKKGCSLAKKEKEERMKKRQVKTSEKESDYNLKKYNEATNGVRNQDEEEDQQANGNGEVVSPQNLGKVSMKEDQDQDQIDSNSNEIITQRALILNKIKKREGSHCPCLKITIIWTIVVVLILVSILRGSKGDSIVGIERCSAADWSLQALLLLVCLLASVLVIIILNREDKLKAKVGYEYDETDIKLSTANVIKLSLFSFIGSTIAIAVGVGGSIIFNPLLLSMGVSPIVSSATSLYLVMFNTFVSSIQFIIIGTLNWQFAGFLSIFIIIGTVTGLSVINGYVKRTGKQSVIVLLLGCVICIGIILTPTITILRLQGQDDIWKFTSLC